MGEIAATSTNAKTDDDTRTVAQASSSKPLPGDDVSADKENQNRLLIHPAADGAAIDSTDVDNDGRSKADTISDQPSPDDTSLPEQPETKLDAPKVDDTDGSDVVDPPPPKPSDDKAKGFAAWKDYVDLVNDNAGPIRSMILALVILLMTTGPALFVSYVAADLAAGGSYVKTPDGLMTFVFSFATNQSDLFNLFNIIALPTITAYFGVKDNKNYGGVLAWLIFTYLIVVFVTSYFTEVVSHMDTAEKSPWKTPLGTIGVQASLIDQYTQNVRNGALAAIAVMAGIKLAKQQEQEKV